MCLVYYTLTVSGLFKKELMENKRGVFIVIDGGEGAGKSTQMKQLKERFGEDVLVTREPGGSPYAEEIRQLILSSEHAGEANALTMFALFWAARADHLAHTIIPALEQGRTVISDRFDSATFSHQIYGQGARDLEDLFWVMREEYLSQCSPDLYIFLDIDPKIALGRKVSGSSEHNHFDERDLDFHERVREGLRAFATRTNAVAIDASKPVNEVADKLTALIRGAM